MGDICYLEIGITELFGLCLPLFKRSGEGQTTGIKCSIPKVVVEGQMDSQLIISVTMQLIFSTGIGFSFAVVALIT